MTFKVRCVDNSLCDDYLQKGAVYEVLNVRTIGPNAQFLVRVPTNRRHISNWYMANRFVKLDKGDKPVVKKTEGTYVNISGRSTLEVFHTEQNIDDYRVCELHPVTAEARLSHLSHASATEVYPIAKPTVAELLEAFKTGKHVRLLGTHGWLTVTDPSVSSLLAPDNVWHISAYSQLVKEFTIPQPLQQVEGIPVVYIPDLATGGAKPIFNPTKADVGFATVSEAVEAAKAIINAIKAGAK